MDLLYYVFSVLCLLCLCDRLFICALWSSAGKGLTSWLLFVVSKCEFVTIPSVSWVRCGTRLYGFLIFAPLLTLLQGTDNNKNEPATNIIDGNVQLYALSYIPDNFQIQGETEMVFDHLPKSSRVALLYRYI